MIECWYCGVDLSESPPERFDLEEPWCSECGAYYPHAEVLGA